MRGDAHDHRNRTRRGRRTRQDARVDPCRAAHLHDRRRTRQRQPRRRLARRRLIAEIRALLLKHRVLFFRDQDITRAEHVAFARHFGELEDHPVAGSDPGTSGPRAHLQVARRADRPLRERVAHRRHLAREAAVRLRSALRRMPAGRRRHDVGQHGEAYEKLPDDIKAQDRGPCAPATASRPHSAPRCRSKSASR